MMPSDNNTPHELPPIQPMTGEVLDALAVEITEHDALRDQHGLPPREGKRRWTRADRKRGNSTGPTAMLDHNGDLIVLLKD
jgi:hypothetical protein